MPFSSSPDLRVLGDVAVFSAPRAALDAIDVNAIVRRAEEDGVLHSAIGLSSIGVDGNPTQVTCRVEMGLRLLCAWIEAVGGASTEEQDAALRATLRAAATAVRAAYEQARRTRQMGCY